MRRKRRHADLVDQLGRSGGLRERAVTRGRVRKVCTVRRIGVDENAAAMGPRSLTLVCDLDEGTVEHMPKTANRRVSTAFMRG